MILERNGGAVSDVCRHFRLVQRIAFQLTLKGGGEKSVAAAGLIKQFQMQVEKDGVEGKR